LKRITGISPVVTIEAKMPHVAPAGGVEVKGALGYQQRGVLAHQWQKAAAILLGVERQYSRHPHGRHESQTKPRKAGAGRGC